MNETLASIDEQNQEIRAYAKLKHAAVQSAFNAVIDHNGGSILSEMYDDAVDEAKEIDIEAGDFYGEHKDELHELAVQEQLARSALN